jgi:hypothetical protein
MVMTALNMLVMPSVNGCNPFIIFTAAANALGSNLKLVFTESTIPLIYVDKLVIAV